MHGKPENGSASKTRIEHKQRDNKAIQADASGATDL